MATFLRFEDIPIWQQARKVCVQIYTITRNNSISRDIRFCSQITAAAGSIMDNIAEGFERDGVKEFIQFLYIAKGSCGEVKSQLYRAFDVGYLDEKDFQRLKEMIEDLRTAIYNYINYLKASEFKGTRYKN